MIKRTFKIYSVILFSAIASIMFTDCTSQNQNEQISYYEESNTIKSRKVFNSNNIKDSGNFVQINYYENGKISEIIEHHQGLIHGSLKLFSPEGTLNYNGVYKNGIKNGVFRWYNEESLLITEELIINGKGILLKNFMRYLDDTTYGYRTYRLRDDTMFETESDIYLNSNSQPIDSISFYYKTNLPDTVKGNDTIDFRVELMIDELGYKGKVHLYLGEFAKDFSLIDTISVFKANFGNHFIHGKFMPTGFGYQVITGIVDIEVINPDNPKEKFYTNLSLYHQLFIK